MSHEIWATEIAELEADLRRVADRLRSLSEARLATAVPGHASRAEGARVLAQVLADVAAGVEQRHAGDAPVWRDLPRLGDLAVGDQVAVTGQDAVTALAAAEPSQPGRTRDGAGDVAGLLTVAQRAVADLRPQL